MRSLGLVAVGLAAYAAQAKSPLGYLPAIGPAPLRFQMRAVGPPMPLPVPPPDASAASVEASAASASAAAGPSVDPATGVVSPATSSQTGSANSSSAPTNAVPVVVDSTPLPLVSPQMLLHYFTDPAFTNRQTAVTVPITFAPALPPPVPGSSSATYISKPKP